MTNSRTDNVIEFPREYLIEQRRRDRWLMIASCSLVMGTDDEPTASVRMILDQYGDAPHSRRNAADIIGHARFAPRLLPDELIRREDANTADSWVPETVFNEWIDAWLPAYPC